METRVDVTAERVARGEHIATVICSGCHSENDFPPLSGGTDLAEEIPIPLGHLTPPNLTPAGPLQDWTDGEIIRAIREGTNRDGHLMVVMSSQSFRNMSDEDMAAVVAYLRSQPSIEHPSPDESLTAVALALSTIGMIPSKPVPDPRAVPAVAKGPSVEYGRYLVSVIGCSECHGDDLKGGNGGILPKGPDLSVVKSWSQEDFFRTMRTGVDPNDRALDPDQMPWLHIGRLEDDELAGLYNYVSSLP